MLTRVVGFATWIASCALVAPVWWSALVHAVAHALGVPHGGW